MIFYIIYLVLSPGIWILLHTVGWLVPKIRNHLTHQYPTLLKVKHKIAQDRRRVVLFHAASAGEFEQLKPVLKKMDRSKYLLVQSFFSPTIFAKESKSPLFDTCCYHPFDFPWSAWFFFKLIKPDYYIITRHDIWPNHVFIAKKMGIQVVLINANLHERSARLKIVSRSANRWVFSLFDKILTGSQRLKENLKILAPEEKIHIVGDTRFDQVMERKSDNHRQLLPDTFLTSQNIIFGSVIPSDKEIIARTISDYFPQGISSLETKNMRLIIVPHETDEETLQLWENVLLSQNINSVRFDDFDGLQDSRAVIVNTVGILADLYKYASIAYVGAGFGAGVHSVIEPAVHGCVVVFGPNIHILDEAVDLFKEKIGFMVKTNEDFARLLTMLENLDILKSYQEKTLHYVKSRPLSSHRIISLIFGENEN